MEFMEEVENPAWEAVFEIIRHGSLPFTYKSFAPAVALDPMSSASGEDCLMGHAVHFILDKSFLVYNPHGCL